MIIVVDTNILFTYFFKNSVAKKIINEEKIDFISPEFSLVEIKKYEKEIIKKARISKKEFNEIRKELVINILFVNELDYKEYLKQAITVSPDENDIDFFALTIKTNSILWSNDKLLKNQKEIIVLNTKELINKLAKLTK